MINVGKLGLTTVVIATGMSATLGVAFGSTASAAASAATPRGDVRACAAPTTPGGARLVTKSNKDGVRYRKYSFAKRTAPITLGNYYLAKAGAAGYSVKGWGGGGSTGGSGFGLGGYGRRCGYLAINSEQLVGKRTYLEVCTGKVLAVLDKCSWKANQ